MRFPELIMVCKRHLEGVSIMKTKALIQLLGAAAVLAMPTGAQTLVVKPTLLDADWETGEWTSGYTEYSQARASLELDPGNLSNNAADRKDYLTFSATDTVARSGDYSIRFYSEPQPADPQPYRTEVAYHGDLAYTLGDELYYSASFRPGADWETGPQSWTTVIAQWKIGGGGRPAFSLGLSNDGQHNLSIARSYYYGPDVRVLTTRLGTLPVEEWTDFVFHFKWSADTDGIARIWKNGDLIYEFEGITWYQGHLSSGYMKVGMYTQLEWEPRTLYIDNVRIGDSSFINALPEFAADSIGTLEAQVDGSFTGSVAGSATDPEGSTLTYTKVEGPAWLIVATDGTLSGTPGPGDVGQNVFTIRVADVNFG